MRRAFALLPVVWLLALLLLPGVAFLSGSRQPNLENRAKTPIPDLNRETLRRDATFKQLDAAILDRLPLRKVALDARGHVSIDVFGDSTSPDVLLGADRWLYYRDELRLCEPQGTPTVDPADAVDVTARALVASGRRTGLMVVGSKMVLHPGDLRDVDAAKRRCIAQAAAPVHARLAQVPGGIDLQSQLLDRERRGEPTFLPSDSHLNATGRELLVRAVLDRIRPGLARRTGLRQGATISRPGDLGRFLGVPRDDRDPTVVATRTPRRPFPAGQVALVGDSQLEYALLTPIGAPSIRDRVLPGQPSCNWQTLSDGACDETVRQASTVILEIVARDLRTFTDTCWRPVTIAGERLRTGRAGRWERTDGGDQPDGQLQLDAGSVQARILTAGPDVRSVPRLIRIPIASMPSVPEGAPPAAVTMVQEPQAGPPAPCATPSQAYVGEALFLPVPAGRRASDLLVRLTAPAGTVLDPPQEIVLDGRTPPVRSAKPGTR